MKGRESGMPPKDIWEAFFHPATLLATMGLRAEMRAVAEFGCGYGTFTLPAARLIQGTVYAVDIDPDMIAVTTREAARAGVRNVRAIRRDFVADGTGLKRSSVDYAMLFNILHIEHPEILLREAWRILRDGGRLGIVHWRHEASTPRGPSLHIRPTPEQCIAWAAGFCEPEQHDLKPYHYGIVMKKGPWVGAPGLRP